VRGEVEDALESVEGNVVAGLGLANARSEDEAEFAGASFFVGVHERDEFARVHVRPRREMAEAADERDDAGDVVRGSEMEFVAEERGGHHAPGDGFTVLIDAIARDGFESVRESVAEVEDFAEAGFALVFGDDCSFDFEAARNDVGEGIGVAAQDGEQIFFEVGEERGVGDDAVLDNFREAAAKLAFGEGFESGGIDENEARGIKRTDEIFAFGKIDAGLAAHGGIDLRDERGGDLNERDAAKTGGGDEAGDVTDDASADGDEERVAVDSGTDERAMEFFGGEEIFGGFGVVHEMRLDVAVFAEAAGNSLPERAPHIGRRDDVDAGEFAEGEELVFGVAKNAAAADDGVFAGGRLDRDAGGVHA